MTHQTTPQGAALPGGRPSLRERVVHGRITLGILEAVALGVVVVIWSALTRAGLGTDQVTGFVILATAVREALDTSAMRLTMRTQRTNGVNAAHRVCRTRLMTWERLAEEIADGRMSFRPTDDEGYYLDQDGNRIEE